jgi:hypothetical protein
MAGKTGNLNIIGYVNPAQKVVDQGCLSVDEQRTERQTEVSKVPTQSKKKTKTILTMGWVFRSWF